MSRITPFIKRMRTNGGTIYTFNSAVEDIGLNINERNNVVKISHFALLNLPKIDYNDSGNDNRFNLKAIPGTLEYFNDPGIKDGRALIAESFQNYALNFESNLLDASTYDGTLTKTVSERVFWKWLKETGAIRWQPDTSGYWVEETETDPTGLTGYKSVVKYVGLVSAGNVRSDSFGTYNETYILVPTSHGQIKGHFEQVEDTNYSHSMKIGNLTENILGRDTYTRPHPDGLSFYGYYDLVDSSILIDTYSVQYDNSTGIWNYGSWFTAEGINPTTKNNYLTDSSSYKTSRIYNISIKYHSNSPSDEIIFKRSKVDCMGLIWNLDTLKYLYGDPNLTFDKMGNEYSINDSFDFNAVLIYYSIYNSVQDTILATNLLGILFLDAPSGNSTDLVVAGAGITIPSLEKIQSGPGGFGTSYSLRLNIKTDNMIDDTGLNIIDEATSSQLYAEDWSEAFYELGKAVNILIQNNSTLNYISQQYITLQANQTQMLTDLTKLTTTVNTIGRDITGTEGVIPLFSAGDDPLIDSSIFIKYGNIGIFNTNPQFPFQVDASIKVNSLTLGNWTFDTSGTMLRLRYSGVDKFVFTTDSSLFQY